jgi:hypothetical protein
MAPVDDGTTSSAVSTATSAARAGQRVALAPGAATATAARGDQRSIRQTTRQCRAASSSDPYIRGTAAAGAVATVVTRGPAIGSAGVALTADYTTVGAADPSHSTLPAGRPVVLAARAAGGSAVGALTGDIDLQYPA